jgi:NADP-dependent 3-hydroxy acid dehydrogenase YdfG
MSIYSGTKFAVHAISEGLRQEAGAKLRVTVIAPGFVQANRAVASAIEQPAGVDVGEIVVRPTAQG